jgi:hypothetical protein
VRCAALALVGSLAACSSAAPDELAQACAALFAHYRAWATACTGAEKTAETEAGLAAHCARQAALPGMTVGAEEIHACARAIDRSDCAYLPVACVTPVSEVTGMTRSVRDGPESLGHYQLFPRSTRGALLDGAWCDLDAQCESGVCVHLEHYKCGRCGRVRQPGEACGWADACAHGRCVERVCMEWGAPVGAPCRPDPRPTARSNCQWSFYCRIPDGGLRVDGGRCAPRLAVGERCHDDPSVENECVDGALCRAGACVAITVVGEGAACDHRVERCEEGLFCLEQRCRHPRSPPPRGQRCGIDLCAKGLACERGICVPARAAGESCAYDERHCGANRRCVGRYLASATPGDGVCGPGLPAGEPCREGECAGPLICLLDGSARRCAGPLPEGAACGTNYRGCALPFECVDGECRAPFRCS